MTTPNRPPTWAEKAAAARAAVKAADAAIMGTRPMGLLAMAEADANPAARPQPHAAAVIAYEAAVSLEAAAWATVWANVPSRSGHAAARHAAPAAYAAAQAAHRATLAAWAARLEAEPRPMAALRAAIDEAGEDFYGMGDCHPSEDAVRDARWERYVRMIDWGQLLWGIQPPDDGGG